MQLTGWCPVITMVHCQDHAIVSSIPVFKMKSEQKAQQFDSTEVAITMGHKGLSASFAKRVTSLLQ